MPESKLNTIVGNMTDDNNINIGEPIPDNDIGAIVEALNMMCELGCCILG